MEEPEAYSKPHDCDDSIIRLAYDVDSVLWIDLRMVLAISEVSTWNHNESFLIHMRFRDKPIEIFGTPGLGIDTKEVHRELLEKWKKCHSQA